MAKQNEAPASLAGIQQVDMTQVMGQETEYKEPAASVDTGKPEPETDPVELLPDEPAAPAPGAEEEDYWSPKEQAEFAVDLIDDTQEPIFRVLHIKKSMGRAKYRQAREYRQIQKAKSRELTGEEKQLLEQYEELLDTIAELPFDEKEKKSMVTPLSAIIQKSGKKMPPEFLFILAITKAMGSRIVDLTM